MNVQDREKAMLAINAGPKVRTTPFPARRLFGAEEKEAVMHLFDDAIEQGSHLLGYNGAQEEAYAREFAEFLGGGYADGVNSGTNAVYLSLRALELEPYGEVVVPPISDPGGIMPVALCNLIPVPADAAPGSYNTSAEQIAARITPRTRAIMVAHIAGIPVDMDPIIELARKHGLPVIEDCAQGHGATYKERRLGSLGTIAAFSTMFGKHHATAGQGGLVFTRDERLYWKVRQHADRGKPFGVSLTGGSGSGVGAAMSAGGNLVAALNCNMDELHACIGRVQLRKLPALLRRRRALAAQIEQGCQATRGVRMIGDPAGCEAAYWFLIFRFDPSAYNVDKAAFVHALAAEGIPFTPSYLFVPTRQPWALNRHAFGDGSAGLPWSAAGADPVAPPLPNTDATDATHFRLGIDESWSPREAEDVLAAIRKVEAAFVKEQADRIAVETHDKKKDQPMTRIRTPIDLGNGFTDLGVAVPLSTQRGTVATADGQGRNVVLMWLFDHRGGYALLMIDAATGHSEEIPMPFPADEDCPYSSLLSSRNRFYTQFNGHFTEFDVARRAFTFVHATTPQMAMSMTEDDQGRIWAASYPNSGVVCFDPRDRSFRDYGDVHAENWKQYPRGAMAADDTGHLYFAIGPTASQILAFDPATGEATPILSQNERSTGYALVYRDEDGQVYGQAVKGAEDGWRRLYRGQATRLAGAPPQRPKPIITSSQALFHDRFPDGARLIRCDLLTRGLAVERPDGTVHEVTFGEYSTDGARIMGVAVAPDGALCGGTMFPFRFFSHDPRTEAWRNEEAFLQFNTVARQGDRFFMGGYGRGFLLEWDPARPWVNTEKGNPACNPRWLTECDPDIYRPHVLLAHPDGKTLVLAGTPGYGYTGGGLLIWDRETERGTLLRHTDLLPDQSIMSLVALPDGAVLCGSSNAPGTGGETKVEVAELFILDLATRRMIWHAPIIPGAPCYLALALGQNGIVYGMADDHRFFAFDPCTRTLLHEEDTSGRFGTIGYQQGQRKFVASPDGTLYLILLNAITRVDQTTHRLLPVAKPPVPINGGGDILDGRLYFSSGSHLYSLRLPGG